jgi:Ser/Thr protein kinase RdoA (MazF antagonist)
MSDPRPEPQAVAGAFGLGTVTGPLRALPGLSRAGVWALSTDRGEWVVKATAAVGPDAVRLERAARAAGIRTPRAVAAPPGETAVRVWERVAGAAPHLPASPELAAWLGRTVATIGRLALVPQSTMDLVNSTVDTPGDGVLAEVAGSAGPPKVLCHRDISSRNILLTADGPVLLDFESAGPQVPWWELVHHAFLLSCRDLGPEEPDPGTIRAAVAAYREHGGDVGPADRTAFAGLAAGLLTWAHHDPAAAAPRLPLIARALDRWSTLLEC